MKRVRHIQQHPQEPADESARRESGTRRSALRDSERPTTRPPSGTLAAEATANAPLLDTARLGSLVPFVRASRDDLVPARANGVSAFVLSLVDGVSSIEAILAVAHMPPNKALRIIHTLWSNGVIGLS
jgi:hypothetical protein